MRVAYLTDGMASSVNASLELSRRLTEAGHEVIYLSHADVGASIEGAGYAFTPLLADRSFVDDNPPVGWGRLRKPRQLVSALRQRRAIQQASIENDEIEQLLTALEPNVLLIDFELHFAVFATARLQIPTFLTTVFFSVFRRPNLPPLGSSRSWRKHWLETRWLEMRQRLIRSVQADWFRPARYGSMDVDTLRAVARSRGLKPRAVMGRNDWQRPMTHPTIPMLSFNLLELELPHEPHPSLHYVGPMARPPDTAINPEWEAFRNKRQPGRPLIYCSLGTHWETDVQLLSSIISTFRRRSEWDLVIGLGGRPRPAEVEVSDHNILLLDYAPQTTILAESRCCITHGGATTLAECVSLGVPAVVYSTGHVDQDGNAARVEFHQIGVVGNRVDDTSNDGVSNDGVSNVEKRVSEALDSPRYQERLAELHEALERARPLAVQLIEAAGAAGAAGTRARKAHS